MVHRGTISLLSGSLPSFVCIAGIDKMTEKSPASVAHVEQPNVQPLASPSGTAVVQPGTQPPAEPHTVDGELRCDSGPEGQSEPVENHMMASAGLDGRPPLIKAQSMVSGSPWHVVLTLSERGQWFPLAGSA